MKIELRDVGHALRSGQGASSSARIMDGLLRSVWLKSRETSCVGEVTFWISRMNKDVVVR